MCRYVPPVTYWGLRDYGNGSAGIGLEETIDEHIAALVDVFGEVRRVLRADGTAWVNYGDAYANDGKWGGKTGGKQAYLDDNNRKRVGREKSFTGLKPKDLMGLPWRLAFALQADGWWLRQDIIWHKPNPMPESITDRCTKAHEYIFLVSKSERYWYDAAAIKEPGGDDWGPGVRGWAGGDDHSAVAHNREGALSHADKAKLRKSDCTNASHAPGAPPHSKIHHAGTPREAVERNKRSVWTVATSPFPEAHFATFPPALIYPCIFAGCPKGGTVLDPFGGAGTTGLVADRLQRNAILIELNPTYAEMAERRIRADVPMMADVFIDLPKPAKQEKLEL